MEIAFIRQSAKLFSYVFWPGKYVIAASEALWALCPRKKNYLIKALRVLVRGPGRRRPRRLVVTALLALIECVGFKLETTIDNARKAPYCQIAPIIFSKTHQLHVTSARRRRRSLHLRGTRSLGRLRAAHRPVLHSRGHNLSSGRPLRRFCTRPRRSSPARAPRGRLLS